MVHNEDDQLVNVQTAARDQFTGPLPTPSTLIQANSPVYHQQYQQEAILPRQFPSINFFQTQQECNANQNSASTNCAK